MKKKKTYSKHDLRRSIEDIEKAVYFMSERLRRFEIVFAPKGGVLIRVMC